MADLVLFETAEHVGTITLNRPDRANSLSIELLADLRQALTSVEQRQDVRAIVVRGAGGKHFSAGFDFTQILTADSDVYDDSRPVRKSDDRIDETMLLLANCRVPTIAMIEGLAVGTGCELAASCDFRLAAEDAMFGMPPVRLGILYSPAAIGMYVNLIGLAGAKELFFSGRRLAAPRALQLGLINAIHFAADLERETYALAKDVAANAPLAVQGTKAIMRQLRPARGPADAGPEVARLLEQAWSSADLREGVKSLLEKRRPLYHGL